MATIIRQSELIHRAAVYINENCKNNPEKCLADLIGEAGMRFNLNPLECMELEKIFRNDKNDKEE